MKPSKNMWSTYLNDTFPIPTEMLNSGRNLISIAFEDTSDHTKNKEAGKVKYIGMGLSPEMKKKTPEGIEDVPPLYSKIRIDAT